MYNDKNCVLYNGSCIKVIKMYNNNKVFQRYKSVSGLKKKHLLTKKISLNKCIEKLGYVTKKHYVKKKV